MNVKLKTWLPAVIFLAAAAVLIVLYFVMPEQRELRRRPEEFSGIFTTLGTIGLYVGAAGFSWLWFRRKHKSPSMLVRKAGKLFYASHKPLGWVTLILVAAHGTFLLLTRQWDNQIYSGLAGFVLLLAIVGYGFTIHKVRNKWMRTVHRTLGLLWVPVLWLHAGGSAIIAVMSALAVGCAVYVLEKRAGQIEQSEPNLRKKHL
ncbi:hypothetical protein [Paenibacillus albus]|uniref:Ferric oxidoreductase domain-containing protein n=1 Tax=Paenibacillus albus TaxID=2495582 RepID=A0A3Q8X5R4_9BACL|nr:hypothetical protein [Paenibacillus albus]AZN40778.1 hypothetical protein EJC50_14750 [Paenibacillus albus]